MLSHFPVIYTLQDNIQCLECLREFIFVCQFFHAGFFFADPDKSNAVNQFDWKKHMSVISSLSHSYKKEENIENQWE